MLIGYALKKRFHLLNEKSAFLSLSLFAVSAAVFITLIAVQGSSFELVLMCKGEYGNIALFLLEGFSGSCTLLLLSVLLSKWWEGRRQSPVRRGTVWIGRNTIGIFLLHKPFLQNVAVAGADALGPPIPNLFVAILCAAVTMAFCCGMILLINRYIPQLFGKFPKAESLIVKEPLEAEEETVPLPEA